MILVQIRKCHAPPSRRRYIRKVGLDRLKRTTRLQFPDPRIRKQLILRMPSVQHLPHLVQICSYPDASNILQCLIVLRYHHHQHHALEILQRSFILLCTQRIAFNRLLRHPSSYMLLSFNQNHRTWFAIVVTTFCLPQQLYSYTRYLASSFSVRCGSSPLIRRFPYFSIVAFIIVSPDSLSLAFILSSIEN